MLVGTDGRIARTSEGFRRDDLEAMARELGMAGPLFTEADAGVPARRPGLTAARALGEGLTDGHRAARLRAGGDRCALLASIVIGYTVPAQVAALKAHFLLALLSTTLLVMAHSFIMFFLIATGVEMKDMEKERGWGDSFRRRTIKMKGQVFPGDDLRPPPRARQLRHGRGRAHARRARAACTRCWPGSRC